MSKIESQIDIREDVLKKRYYKKDNNGKVIENWENLCHRVADTVSFNEDEKKDFYNIMYNLLFLPNSPALINAGNPDFTLSACFVLPVEDSMEGIFDAVKHAAIVNKMGGGTGFSFSRLRPSGSIVGSTKGVASGPVSFMAVFDKATETIKQGGVRRGANMGVMRVDHPDIIDFITAKKTEGMLSNFNLSVGITDKFMQAVEKNDFFDLVWKGEVVKKIEARKIMDLIVEMAWNNGEPGLIFLDKINADNPTPHIGEIEATNPCGEQPLLPYEACVLGSVNLAVMVENKEINWDLMEHAVKTGSRMLDNIIDIQSYPLPQIKQMHTGNRKIGLGVMGWADMLIKLGINYASAEAVHLAEKVMQFITNKAVEQSIVLAEEKGVFPNWEGSIWYQKGIKIRNAALTTIAPTGTISIIANCSSGIEPIFNFVTEQNRMDEVYSVYHPLFNAYIKENGINIKIDKNGKIIPTNGKRLPDYFITAEDVPVDWHIKMQAAFQKYTHNAISKTINLPNSATKEDIRKAYILAYKLGCKGITVYRDGSRKQQVLSSTGKKEKSWQPGEKLPDIMDAKRIYIDTPDGTTYFHISLTENKEPIELFIQAPVKSKYHEVLDLFAKTTSLALRYGCPSKKVIKQLEETQEQYGHVSSVSGMLLRAFRKIGASSKDNSETCPECQGILVLEEGCVKCYDCGYSAC